MGYDIRVVKEMFFIAKKNKLAALEAIQEAAAEKEAQDGKLRWGISALSIRESESLKEALCEFGWVLERDRQGNYIGIDYEQEKMGDDFFWHSLAPFIKKGSYIEMSGNGGEDRFRYYFDGKCFREQEAVITWKDKD